jgi:hypothetical protein
MDYFAIFFVLLEDNQYLKVAERNDMRRSQAKTPSDEEYFACN